MAIEKVSFPMVGMLIAVNVKVGDTVEQNQTLATFESMKMQLTLEAPCAGVVKEILVEAGQAVKAEQVFGTIEHT